MLFHIQSYAALVLIILLFTGCSKQGDQSVTDVLQETVPLDAKVIPTKLNFNEHVKPILSNNCFACHGPDAENNVTPFRLDSYEAITKKIVKEGEPDSYGVVPGYPEKSEIIRRILSKNDSEIMPPPVGTHKPLNEEQIAILEQWIREGAKYEKHWSYVLPKKSKLPEVKNTAWPREILDHFILSKIEAVGLSPSPEIDPELWLRRASFDLTGLPPSPEDLDLFLNSSSIDPYEEAVDRLLKSSNYGEHLTAEWLDVARYADSHGYQNDRHRTMWPWRQWVMEAFNKNMPYDQFILWQLAGDQLPNPTPEMMLATGFNRNHRINGEAGIIPEEFRVEYVADRVATTSTAFLGMTMDCARCHDHKYDPIPMDDYYSMFAFFNNTSEEGSSRSSDQIISHPPHFRYTPIAKRPKYNSLKADLHQISQRIKNEEARLAKNPELYVEALDAITEDTPVEDLNALHKTLLAHQGFDSYSAALFKNKSQFEQNDGIFHSSFITDKIGANDVQFRELDIRKSLSDTSPFTASIFIKPTKRLSKNSYPLLALTDDDIGSGWVLSLAKKTPKILKVGIEGKQVWKAHALEIEDDMWTHIAFTVDPHRANPVMLYVNAQPVELKVDNKSSNVAIKSGINTLAYGIPPLGEKHAAFRGLIDEMRLYSIAASHEQIKTIGKISPIHDILIADKENGFNKIVDRFPTELGKNIPLVKQLYDDQKSSIDAISEFEENSSPYVMIMDTLPENKARTTYVLDRGTYDAPIESRPREPAVPSALGALDALPKNRKGLAMWLISDANPLTSRVTVNRYWQLLFGNGLVRTSEDFGSQGSYPTHHALLDYLSVQFQESGWDLKALLKSFVLSSTYRQSSVVPQSVSLIDPSNKLLSYFPTRKLTAEMCRDQALAVSDLLVDELGGPSVKPYQPDGLWKEQALSYPEYVQGKEDDLYRRSIYTFWKRGSTPPSMMIFDTPGRDMCTVKRESTNTPLQALVRLNDPTYVEASTALAAKVLTNHSSFQDRINYAFKALISRSPSKHEVNALKVLYDTERAYYEANPEESKALLSAGEFKADESLLELDLATYTILVSTIMNFYESMIK